MDKMTVRDIDVSTKKVLVRVDFNVPTDVKTGAITDDSRIRATLPTIRYLIERNARVILISHLGKPNGKIVDELRLTPVAQRLSQLLGQQVSSSILVRSTAVLSSFPLSDSFSRDLWTRAILSPSCRI